MCSLLTFYSVVVLIFFVFVGSLYLLFQLGFPPIIEAMCILFLILIFLMIFADLAIRHGEK